MPALRSSTSVSLDWYSCRRSAQPIVSLFNFLVGANAWRMLVQFCELFYEADNTLLVYRWLPTNPLSLAHAVLNVVETWCWPVNLWNLMWMTVILIVLINLGRQRFSLIELLNIVLNSARATYPSDRIILVRWCLLTLKFCRFQEPIAIIGTIHT